MYRWLRRSAFRPIVTACVLVTLLVSESSARAARPGHDAELRAPESSEVLADAGAVKRPLTLPEHRSKLATRFGEVVSRRRVRIGRGLLRHAHRTRSPLPPARMRYRRTTHDDEGEPPA
jgi:hypothetical protein